MLTSLTNTLDSHQQIRHQAGNGPWGCPWPRQVSLGYLWAGPKNGFTTSQHTGSKYSPTASVTTNQGTVLGGPVTDGTFPEPAEGFMGIPYALPPVGQLGFRRAVPVPSGSDTLRAFELGPRCPGKQLVPLHQRRMARPGLAERGLPDHINVYHPRGHTADEGGRKLPVAVTIPGGAFNRGARPARIHNTPSMLAWSEGPWVGVAGGLNTALTEKEGLLSLGLKEMCVALEWVQENIAAFGGDPDHVAIMGGLSAAAHGIGHLIMDVKQKKKTLFHKAIMDSGGHTARVVHPPDSKLNEAHFQEFLELTGCGNRPEHEILPCLRAVPSSTSIDSGHTVYKRSNPSVRWAWQPVLDGDIISRRPIDAWKSNRWNKVPIFTGSAHNEGAMYVSRTASTPGDFADFFRTLLPQLSEADVAELKALYPYPSTDRRSLRIRHCS
ncbi:Lipase 1, partial [Colletotrichum shisoi]